MVGQELNTNLLPNAEKFKLFKILVKNKDKHEYLMNIEPEIDYSEEKMP